MKKLNLFKFLSILLIIITVIYACTKEKKMELDKTQEQSVTEDLNPNLAPDEIPPATVELISSSNSEFKSTEGVGTTSLTPTIFTATLRPGESATESKLVSLAATPPAGDILFMLDLTGSMGGALNNVKVNSTNIMNALRGLIPDSRFGAISHMDYLNYYSSCDYSFIYGSSFDYPYRLDQSLTTILGDVSSSINALILGNGYDAPESYSRALFETANDAAIGWRSGAKKIVVAWLDMMPHDCNVYQIIGKSGSTGASPGRDGIIGNTDDLAILDVLQDMADKNITLIVLNNGYYQALWNAFAEIGRAHV